MTASQAAQLTRDVCRRSRARCRSRRLFRNPTQDIVIRTCLQHHPWKSTCALFGRLHGFAEPDISHGVQTPPRLSECNQQKGMRKHPPQETRVVPQMTFRVSASDMFFVQPVESRKFSYIYWFSFTAKFKRRKVPTFLTDFQVQIFKAVES